MATKDFNQLTSAVLSLPVRQRAKLAQELWQSIGSEDQEHRADKKLLTEIKKRDREISEGTVRCKSHTAVMAAARKAIKC